MSDPKDQNLVDQDIIQIDFDLADLKQVSQTFFDEAKHVLEDLDQQLLKLEKNPQDEILINQLFRKIHTLKGAVGAVPGGQLLGSLAHEFEALLSRIKKEKKTVNKACIDLFLHSSKLLTMLADSLRKSRDIYPEELSAVIETITRYGQFTFDDEAASGSEGDLANEPFAGLEYRAEQPSENDEEDGVWLSNAQLREISQIAGELLVLKNLYASLHQEDTEDRRAQEFVQGMNRISDQLQSYVTVIRKEPVSECFKTLPVLVRQTSAELNKEVELTLHGLELSIDKGLGHDIYGALIHIVRNSIDHGIEDVFDRTTAGKPPKGQLKLEVFEKSGVVYTVFSDDGRGLDVHKIKSLAIKKGLISEESAEALSEQEVFQFIFHPGFSTKEKITTVSGRGVGMDVVQATVQKYKGHIEIESKPEQGTKITLVTQMPQNVMVEATLVCSYEKSAVAVPLSHVGQIKSCEELHITEVDGLRWAQIDSRTVPLMTYSEYIKREYSFSKEQVAKMSVVVMNVKDQMIGILVDKVERQTDLVIKAFDPILGTLPGFKGTSVLSDDKIAYIVDPESFVSMLFDEKILESRAA